MSANLWQYRARMSDDPAKTDFELVHEQCGKHLCDIEHDDTIEVLVSVCANHEQECEG